MVSNWFKVGLNDVDEDDIIGLAAGGARDVNNFRSYLDDVDKDKNIAPKRKQRKGNKRTEHFEEIVAEMPPSLVMMGNDTFISRIFSERI